MIVTVANQKGGVGKTDLCVNLASCLAQMGKRVLVIDMDPQGNASGYLLRKKPKKTTTDLLVNKRVKLKDVAYSTDVDNLFVVPGDQKLNAASLDILNDAGMQFRLKRKIGKEIGYEYIFIDTPPSLGPLTINALTASDGVVVPVQVHYLATEGVNRLMNTVDILRKEINSKLNVLGYVLTMYDKRNKLSGRIEEIIRNRFGEKVFSTAIPINVDIAAAPEKHSPLAHHKKSSIGAYAYRNLAKEFLSVSV